LVSFYVDLPALAQEGNPPPKVYPPDAFVRVGADGRIVISINRLEFGQGVSTGLPMIVADEMDADWSQVQAELAPAADVYRDPLFGLQMTGGSASIANSFQQYRELGARTRAMLVAPQRIAGRSRPMSAARPTVSSMARAIRQPVMRGSRTPPHAVRYRTR